MKTKKTAKIIVPVLATTMAVALVGSISGSAAWFLNSNMSQAEFQGASAHCTENMEIRINDGTEVQNPWKSDLTYSDVATYLQAAVIDGGAARSSATNLRPVTSGALAEFAVPATSALKKSPVRGVTSPADWQAATAEDYVLLPLEIRVQDVDGSAHDDRPTLAKDIYLTDLTIQASRDNVKEDISNAIRVGISADTTDGSTAYATFAKGITSTTVAGPLLNVDHGTADQSGYSFQENQTYLYGVGTTGTKASYPTLAAGAYVNVSNTLYTYAAGALTAVTPAPTVYANIAARDAAAGVADALCFVTSTGQFYRCTAAGTPGTWAVLDVNTLGGGYVYGSDTSKYYSVSGTTLTEYTLPVAVTTSNAAVASDVKGVAVLNADKSAKTYGVALGSATASLTLKVNVLIYLEGWQTLGATPSAMWGDNYIGAKFDVGMRFETIIHDDTHA